MSRRDRRERDRARLIAQPLLDPSLPPDAHRGIADQDREELGNPTGHIQVDGEPFAYWMPNGQPLTAKDSL
jgi:hypothetical protein